MMVIVYSKSLNTTHFDVAAAPMTSSTLDKAIYEISPNQRQKSLTCLET